MKPHRGQWKTRKTGLIRIKKKGDLKTILRNEGYGRIAIWADGVWADVGTGYGGEQDGDNPITYIQRSNWYNLTWKEIDELVAEKEGELNR